MSESQNAYHITLTSRIYIYMILSKLGLISSILGGEGEEKGRVK